MKKAKAHMACVSKNYPKGRVKDAMTSFEAYSALKHKYSIAKNQEYFTKLDKDQDEFKLSDDDTDPDKIIVTLEEYSEKLCEFVGRYNKDTLPTLIKLRGAKPATYDCILNSLIPIRSIQVELIFSQQQLKE